MKEISTKAVIPKVSAILTRFGRCKNSQEKTVRKNIEILVSARSQCVGLQTFSWNKLNDRNLLGISYSSKRSANQNIYVSLKKSTGVSSNFLVWKFCGKTQFPHSFGRNCALQQNFQTRKLGEITILFAVMDVTGIARIRANI